MTRPDITAYIGANDRDFQAAMARVRSDASRTGQSAGSSFSALAGRLRGFGEVASTIGGATTAAAAAVVAFANAAKRAADAVLEIDASARTAGVGFEAFQELKFVAEQNLIGVDALTDGLKEMQLRADEVIKTGTGPAAESFRRLNLSVTELAEGLKQPDKLLETIVERLKAFDKAAQIRIADELFGGTAGEQFVRLLDDASTGIAEGRAQARELGIVLDEDVRRKAEEINREWNKMATIVSTKVKGSILEVAGAILEAAKGLSDLMERGFRVEVPATSYRDVIDEMQVLKQEREQVVTELDQAAKSGNIALQTRFEQDLQTIDQQMAELKRRLASIQYAYENLPQTVTPPAAFNPGVPAPGVPVPTERPNPESMAPVRNASAAAADREANAIKSVIEGLEMELRMIGLSDVEREKAIELRRAGVEEASTEGQRIAELVEQIHAETAAREESEEATQRQVDAVNRLLDTTEGWIEQAIKGTLDWKTVLIDLIRLLQQAATAGQGIGSGGGLGFGGLFSGIASLFGGGRATGGDVSPGRYYQINEKEYFAPASAGRIIPPGGGGGTSRVRIELGDGLVGQILDQAHDQAIDIVSASAPSTVNAAVAAVGLKARKSPGYLR